ncbi:TonB-dependent receptor [Teredinibacter turnerae]|uniref:TonB-dependent receptor plug domain-containing protein n=1 Tax=Teredinibacter turnerae TaxID=2426 RepID=UPI0030CC44D2
MVTGSTRVALMRSLFLGVLSAFTNNYVAAAEQEPSDAIFNLSLKELGELKVSIATGTPNSVANAPAVTSVITASDIANLGARTLDEVLQTVPGLYVSLSHANRLDTVYSMRGLHSSNSPHVLLLLDGNPVQWALTGGRPFLYRLPANIVERIEVIRGPGSALYGSDAFSGVINVITKTATNEDAAEMGVRAGSFNSRDVMLNYSGQLGAWRVSTLFSSLATDGDDRRVIQADTQTFLDYAYGTNVSQAPGPLQTGYHVYDFHLKASSETVSAKFWYWTSRDTGNGSGGAQALDPYTKEQFSSYFVDLQYAPVQPVWGWQNRIKASYFNHEADSNFTLLPAGARVPIGADGNIDFANPAGVTLFSEGVIGKPSGVSEDVFLDWITEKSFSSGHALRLSGGYRKQSLDSREWKNFGPGILDGTQESVDGSLVDVSNTEYVFLPDSEREIYHLTFQDEWQLSQNLTFTGGVRYDNYSDFGGTTNPRLALVWDAKQALTAKLLYGSAFRAPSFGELFFQNNPSNIGNPDLKPEKIDTLELAMSYQVTEQLQTSLNIYRYTAENLIEYITTLRGAQASNARDQEGEGIEFEVSWHPGSRFNVSLNGAWQKSYDTDTGYKIADAPARQATLLVNWAIAKQWLLNVNTRWIAGRGRIATDTRPEIDDYSLTDLHLVRTDVVHGLDLGLRVTNVFDSDARDPSVDLMAEDFPLEGDAIWLEASYSL